MKYLTRLSLFALLFAFAAPVWAQQSGLAIGGSLPMADHPLSTYDGQSQTLGAAKGAKGTVVVFWSNDCPWSTRLEDRVIDLASRYKSQGIGFILVNSNDGVAFPKEGEPGNKSYGFPYVVDKGSSVAKAFGASRTPHVYVFDANGSLAYIGAIDDSPGDAGNVQKRYLEDALKSVVAGSPVAVPETKAFGCTVKLQN